MKTALIFPGQGAQSVGMGRDLFERHSLAPELFDRAYHITGIDFKSLIFEGPESSLVQTNNLQPALTLMNIMTWEILYQEMGGFSVDYVAGHSLGEISAVYATGSLDFSNTIQLVQKRGQYMHNCAKINPGTMLAVLRLSPEELIEYIQESDLPVDIANYNAPGQIIVSGEQEAIDSFRDYLTGKGVKKILPLKVSGPWHSRNMNEARDQFAVFIEKIDIKDPNIPVISNITARAATSGIEIKKNLVHQITGSVYWTDSVEYLIKKGVQIFIECGPGNILSGLIKRIDPSVQTYSISNYEELTAFKNKTV